MVKKSNREAMHGRFDLCILPKQIFHTALVLECKHSKSVKDLIKDASEELNKSLIINMKKKSSMMDIFM